MKLAAADAIAAAVPPETSSAPTSSSRRVFDTSVAERVALGVAEAAVAEGVTPPLRGSQP